MTDLDRSAAAARRSALAIERESQRTLTLAYKSILARLQSDIEALTRDIAAAQERGEVVNASWINRQSRARTLIQQTEAEIGRYSRTAEQVIANGQRAAATAALDTSEAVLAAALGTPPPGVVVAFNRLPVGAIEELVGNLGDGRPLSALLDGLGTEASAAGRTALLEALGRGIGPRAAAREFRKATGVAAVRALRISRQEINRSFRDAGLANLRQNADVCSGWTWLAAGGPRTCAACYAKHGTVHKLSDPFQSHVCCRCACVPLTKSWAELGFGDIPDTRPELPDRDTLFGRLSEAEQRQVLGVGAFDLWQAGEIALTDMATPTRSRVWGGGIKQTPLRELQAQQAVAAD